MTEEDQLYRLMHRAKIKVAISASLLIGAMFLAIFMGAFEVSAGLADARYNNCLSFNMPVPADGGQPFQVVGYSSRYVTLKGGGNNKDFGSHDHASIFRFDLTTGDHLVNESAPEPSMAVGHVENVNEWYDGSGNAPLLLVQFAGVKAPLTTGKMHVGDTQTYQFHNETMRRRRETTRRSPRASARGSAFSVSYDSRTTNWTASRISSSWRPTARGRTNSCYVMTDHCSLCARCMRTGRSRGGSTRPRAVPSSR
jgi:hypothetical protein